MILKSLFTLTLSLSIILPSGFAQVDPAGGYVRYSEPAYFTYEELKRLSVNPTPRGALGKKLHDFWRSPIISNEAYYSGAKPKKPSSPELGEFLRVMTWNIEKSINMDEAIKLLTASDLEFKTMIHSEEAEVGSENYYRIIKQRKRLLEADIIILQEMEIGVKRSKYWNATRKLAKALNMNYAFAAQYLEVDPVILGTETILYEDGTLDKDAMAHYKVDPERYKGMFGSAVLSRYPIKHVEVEPLDYQPYDWYEDEKDKIGFLETVRRSGAKGLFKNEMTREMKVGGRHYFRIDLDVPELREGMLSVINIHLEIKCQPKDRKIQMDEILSKIQGLDHPVIMAGDYNAAPADISPTSFKRVAVRTAKNPTTWLSAAVNAVSPHSMAINTTRGVSNVTKNFNDPFAKDIKVVAPNKLKPMFKKIKYFEFDDGRSFDLRGDSLRSINEKSKLAANSNERGTKGFKTTFQVRRPLGIVGKFRLDWFFIKSYGRQIGEVGDYEFVGPYKFAPHFGETMEELNTSLKKQISDHHPSVVDLPFGEPNFSKIST